MLRNNEKLNIFIFLFFQAVKLEKWTPTDREWKCIPDGTSYVGYRTCNTEPKELASLLDEVEACCNVVAQGIPDIVHLFFIYLFLSGEDVKLLGMLSFILQWLNYTFFFLLGEDAKLLGYNAKAVYDCVLR